MNREEFFTHRKGSQVFVPWLFLNLETWKFCVFIEAFEIVGAGGRTRTDMSSEARQILSLVRIPISPLRLKG